MGKKFDLVGEVFTRLTVLEKLEERKNGNIQWLCECSCGSGKKVVVITRNLRNGDVKSCGCYRKDLAKNLGMASRKYLLTENNEQNIYYNMIERCTNKNNTQYYNYGGRGIKVCDRWLESFGNFFEDLGPRPSKNHSIERLDVNKDYCPENCIWIENSFQGRNRRKQSNNTSGVTGVHYKESKSSWVASWYDLDTGAPKNKWFSINKYGNEEAFRLACDYRKKMIQELNEKGAGYSDSHGL